MEKRKQPSEIRPGWRFGCLAILREATQGSAGFDLNWWSLREVDDDWTWIEIKALNTGQDGESVRGWQSQRCSLFRIVELDMDKINRPGLAVEFTR